MTVGFHTRIGRGLIPNVTAKMATLLPEWKLLFRQIAWSDPTVGLASGEVDVAVAWLPVPDNGKFSWKVVSTEDRWVALPSGHRLASRGVIPLTELADEPFIALPRTAGPLREFWLGNDQRPVPARVIAEAETAEESIEAVGSGLGVVLLAEGNAQIYQRTTSRAVPLRASHQANSPSSGARATTVVQCMSLSRHASDASATSRAPTRS